MELNEKETQLLTELKNQEQLCAEKYKFYAGQAKSEELKKLFLFISEREQTHYNMVDKMLNGELPKLHTKKPIATDYEPQKGSSYKDESSKEFDKLLCTDSIATEKYVASDYNNDLFHFASTDVRDLLNAIMTDEQNHAEMIYKYKEANDMVA